MSAAQTAQLGIVGALHTKTDPGDAGFPEPHQAFPGDGIRVCFQGDFGPRQRGGRLHQGRHLRRGEQCRSAAAKIEGVGAAGVLFQFPQQGIHVGLRHRTGPRRGIEITVPALGFAVGNVEINTKRIHS